LQRPQCASAVATLTQVFAHAVSGALHVTGVLLSTSPLLLLLLELEAASAISGPGVAALGVSPTHATMAAVEETAKSDKKRCFMPFQRISQTIWRSSPNRMTRIARGKLVLFERTQPTSTTDWDFGASSPKRREQA